LASDALPRRSRNAAQRLTDQPTLNVDEALPARLSPLITSAVAFARFL